MLVPNARAVCFCNSHIPWGGGEKWHLEAALSFARRGWKVFLLAHPKGDLFARAKAVLQGPESSFLPPDALEVLPLPIGKLTFLNPRAAFRLRRFFREQAIHAVILNLSTDLKLAGPAARAAGVPHIVYRRGSALPVRDSLLNRRLFGGVITRLIVNSEATKTLVPQRLLQLLPPDAVTVLANGIDVAAFDRELAAADSLQLQREQRPRKIQENAENDNPAPDRPAPLVIGNAGRLNKQKGQHMLLLLARRLADLGLDFHLLIAGRGEREEELQHLAKKLDILGYVYFSGFMENMGTFWKSVDIFVLTSLWEGFGFVLLEAMLAEKPILAFAVSNVPELIKEGENGLLFPLPKEERDSCPEPGPLTDHSAREVSYAPLDAMARAIVELARDPKKRKAMTQAGRTFAETHFSQERRMDELEALLQ